MDSPQWSVYTVSPSVCWVVDEDRVVVVDAAVPSSHVLQGQEALIWRLLGLPLGYRGIARVLGDVTDLGEAAAGRELCAVLERWSRLGVLRRGGEVARG